MNSDLTGLWEKALDIIKTEINAQSYQTWFKPTRQISTQGPVLEIEVPNDFFKGWLEEHYSEKINEAIKRVAGESVSVKFIIGQSAEGVAAETAGIVQKHPVLQELPLSQRVRPEFPLNPKYTFDGFVVGPSNRIAHAASLAVAESPATAYNPLFIYGGVGLGKTHLMQAMGHHIINKDRNIMVLYITSERFTNQLINAIQNRSTLKFREKYRSVDVLLIDDIHFIGGKEATQEEFFHTFNTLYDSRKQIVISSDRSPNDIPGLEKRLVSRFVWGMVTDIQPPDFETRMAILRKKMEKELITVPDDVMFFIADKIKSNIRELEGALIRVVAYSSLVGHRIDLDLAKEVLKDVLVDEVRKITVELIQRIVSEYFNIRLVDMKTKKRSRMIVYPRQVAMYLARELTDYSLFEIGQFFGGRDHTTIIHAHEKIKSDLKTQKNTKTLIDKLIIQIKG